MPLENRTVPDLVNQIVGNIRGIFRGEIRLAVTELKEEASVASRAAISLGIGVVLGLYAGGLLFLGAVYALTIVLQPWAAALVVAAGTGLLAAIFVTQGMKRFKKVQVKPTKTITSIKENAAWVKHQVK